MKRIIIVVLLLVSLLSLSATGTTAHASSQLPIPAFQFVPGGEPMDVGGAAPPDMPALVAPGDGSSDIDIEPVLEVAVSDPDSDSMDVTFFGREVDTSTTADFTVIVLPDTQFYSQYFPYIFTSQTEWIVDNRETLNIVYVAHEGDIVNYPDSTVQWNAADAAMSLLEDPIITGMSDGIPYGIVPGNHDTPTDLYNQYFGISRFTGRSYYGGHYGDDNNNNYTLFSAAGMDFIVINLEFEPDSSILFWADSVLKTYSDRRAIVVSHYILNIDDSWGQEEIFTSLKDNPNLFLMLCGHMHSSADGEARRTETGDYGNTVYVLLADYQEYPNGGEGYLRTLTFSPQTDQIYVNTYSPWKDDYKVDPESQFTLAYEMDTTEDFINLGTVTGIASGESASINWPGLTLDTEYQWYVKVSDGLHETTGSVWSFITGDGTANEAPIADGQSVDTLEDTALPITLTASDINNDALTYSIVDLPSHGTITGIAPDVLYTPALDYFGSDSFTFKVNDGQLDSNIATVSIYVEAVNDPPLVVEDTYNIASDTMLVVMKPGVLDNDIDVDGDTPTAILVGDVTHGSLTLNNDGSFNYQPTPGFIGGDSFTYQANDGQADSNIAAVSITVTPPVATFGLDDGNGSWNVGRNYINVMRFQNNAGTGELTNLEIFFDDVTPAGKARLGIYADNSGIPDNLLLDAGEVNVANGWVSISELSLPVIRDQYYWLGFNLQSPNVVRLETGHPSDTHYWAGYTYGPLPGQINLSGAGYNGDWFVMRVTITLDVANTPPISVDDIYGTSEDTLLIVNAPGVLANDTDADGDTLTAVLVSDVANGNLTLSNDGSFSYMPDAGYTGSDSFTYQANDGQVDSNIATVSINVTVDNTPPVASDDSYAMPKDVSFTVVAPGILLNDIDADEDTLTVVLVSDVVHGVLNIYGSGTFNYTPNPDFVGDDSFTYKVYDGLVYSNIATVSIHISTSPVAGDDVFSTAENAVLAVDATGVLANDTDADGDTLVAWLIQDVSHGTLYLYSDGSFIYTPETGYTGTDSFTYQADDGTSNSNTATVVITITESVPTSFGLNSGDNVWSEHANYLDAMRFRNDTATGAVKKLELLIDDSTPAGKVRLGIYSDNNGVPGSLLHDAGEVEVANGWVSISGLSLPVSQGTYYWLAFILETQIGVRYQSGQAPGSHYWSYVSYGALPVAYPVSGAGYNNNQYVMRAIVTMEGNTPPIAMFDTSSTNEGTMLTMDAPGVLANDTDANGDTLTAVLVSDVIHGSLTLNSDGSFNYMPDAGYTGGDSFTYKANDGQADSDTSIVTINVNSSNIPPTAGPDAYVASEGTMLVLDAPGVLANDTDANGDTLTAVLVSDVIHGSLTLNVDGSFDYMPDAGYTGGDSFTYKANDGQDDSDTSIVTINVISSNIPPIAGPDAYVASEGTVLVVDAPGVLANDTDVNGDTLTAVLVSDVIHGSLTLNSDGSFNYMPDAGYTGGDSFTYKANDGQADSNTSTVIINIDSSNIPPIAGPDAYVASEGTVLVVDAPGVLANDTDANGDTLTAILVSDVIHGSLTLNSDGSFSYMPDTGYTGGNTFTYKANDGQADSNTATVVITITGYTSTTFGLDNGNESWNESPNYLNALRFTNNAGTGTLTRLELLIDDSTPVGNIRFGIYADDNGVPGSLLLDAGEVEAANGWVSIHGLNLPVSQGTYYWLVYVLEEQVEVRYQSGQATGSHYWANVPYGALPAIYPVSGAGSNNNQYVIRATVVIEGT